jgi:selenocysteine-specific elongation factor
VVTGTLQEGTVRIGDELTATPASRPLRIRGLQSLGSSVAQASGVARVALNLRGISTGELGRGMALISADRWTMTRVIDVRLTPPRAGERDGAMRLPPELTLHIGAARVVARVRMLGSHIVRLSLAHPLPLHVGDRVLLRDPGAAADLADGRPICGAPVLDVPAPRLRGRGAAAAADRELASWPDRPEAPDLLRRHRLLRVSGAEAMGLRDLPPPVSGEWLADPAHWQRLRKLLVAAVAANAQRDPLAPGLPVDAARAELRLPDRGLVEALAARGQDGDGEPIDVSGGYLRRGAARSAGTAAPSLPAPVARAVQTVLDGLADAPFSAPEADRLRELGLDARGAAAAERAGLLRRLPGNLLLAPDAGDQAARILATLPQPFTAADARQALKTTRRVVIPLLEWLDREGITRRLPDNRRTMREPPGHRGGNGGR